MQEFGEISRSAGYGYWPWQLEQGEGVIVEQGFWWGDVEHDEKEKDSCQMLHSRSGDIMTNAPLILLHNLCHLPPTWLERC